ncbi:MAG: prepilin peptidase [Chloroflexi bacterium]|nr:MAG: prepilin peptidase [Chloroflexota bacterium]
MTPLVIAAAAAFAVIGGIAERVASVWPPDEARRRPPGVRTAGLALGAGLSAAAVAWRSALPLWATLVYLAFLAGMVFLSATDLEQRRLPHILLDPLIVASLLFAPFNPAVKPLDAGIGAVVALGFLGVTGLLVRGGIALGDLYLIVPIGLLLGWPTIFTAIFLGALLSAAVGIALLVTRRAGMRSYIPFGPFLVAGLVLALVWDPTLLGPLSAIPG